jgi:hypothetical protein
MNTIYRFIKKPALAILLFAGLNSCQKISRPALGDYTKDEVNLPDGDLRFYLPFDSTSEDAKQLNIRFKDSISGYPSFFPDPTTTYIAGVQGTAYQGSTGTFLHYVNANDFGKATSFTISFWLQATIDQKDHVNADGVLALSSTKNFWSNVVVYADHEASTSDSMQLKFHFANGDGDNWDFAGYTGDSRWPHMYDGVWHHVAFVYDAPSSTATLYRDGVQFDQKTNETIAFDGNADQFIVGGFQEAVNLVDSYANNSWMSGWPGGIDQVRLYSAARSASDVQALYNNKQ